MLLMKLISISINLFTLSLNVEFRRTLTTECEQEELKAKPFFLLQILPVSLD